ncbi:MAG: FAD:protein FMN transferase [Clostridia bacterium]|nr:FAD:protein FMN transferase [Clostridia bacterium]
MKKRMLALLFAVSVLTATGQVGGGIAGPAPRARAEMARHSLVFFDTFDTVVTIIGYAEDKATFDRVAGEARAAFERYHQLYDAYHVYEGIQNICTLNRDAAQTPVPVDEELWDLLVFAMEWQPRLEGTVNIALGSVTGLWQASRKAADAGEPASLLPDTDALREAAAHTHVNDVVLDEERRTVFFRDPSLKLDVGAVAKGFATELVCRQMLASDMPSFMINAGGNVRAGHGPAAGRSLWGVGLQDPEAALSAGADQSMDVLYVEGLSVVTSGDYHRFFVEGGVRYHHIIDPATLLPAWQNHSVTILCEDGGLADILSTAVFILPYERGRALVDSLDGVEALWVRAGEAEGEARMTEGMRAYSKNAGAVNPER